MINLPLRAGHNCDSHRNSIPTTMRRPATGSFSRLMCAAAAVLTKRVMGTPRAHGTLQVGGQLDLGARPECLVGALPALHARRDALAADPVLPLVRAPRCPAAAAIRRFLPAARKHILAATKQPAYNASLRSGAHEDDSTGAGTPASGETSRSRRARSCASSRAADSRSPSNSRSLAFAAAIAMSRSTFIDTCHSAPATGTLVQVGVHASTPKRRRS